jgi:hypothetical protein
LRKGIPILTLLAGIWTAASPWLYRTSSGSMSGGHMQMGNMAQSSSGVAVTASTYYWHIVPGAIAIAISLALLFWTSRAATALLAGALLLVGIWTAAGPWFLPQMGLGASMNMGLTAGGALRHIVPGAVMTLGAVALFGMLPAGRRGPVAARQTT